MALASRAYEARALADRGRHQEAITLYRQLVDEAHVVDPAYNSWLRGLAGSLAHLGRKRNAAFILLYTGELHQALNLLDESQQLERGTILQHAGQPAEAARSYEAAGRPVLAAIAYEQAGRDAQARTCWERGARDPRLTHGTYEQALVSFNLGNCCLRLGDDAGHAHLVQAQRLLEEAADGFETSGQRERAFDCYQILLELGRRSGGFENLAEGYINCIRILQQDNLKYYVLQYYEDFLQQALERQEHHAAASLYREAAEYCLRTGLIYEGHYLRAAAETWLLAAEKNLREGGPLEMSENAYLAAVDCFNTVGDYSMVGEAYHRLSQLKLPARKRQRYASITARYAGARPPAEKPAAFPDYLRKPHAYPEIWHMDLVEWQLDGEVGAVCGAIVGDQSYPEVVRRRALTVLLDYWEIRQDQGQSQSQAALAQVAEALGDLQVYVVLRPLERLFVGGQLEVRRGVMRALRCLFFKRTFVLLGQGLQDGDAGVRQGAIEALGRLHFNHAFDPLVRIFRELEDSAVRGTALESIGRIPSLEAGDFLVEVLRYEPEPYRSQAKRLLVEFENRDLVPILRQHYQLEAGPSRADLEDILRRVQRGLAG